MTRLVHPSARRPALVLGALAVGVAGALLFAASFLFGVVVDSTGAAPSWLYRSLMAWGVALCWWRAAAVRADRGAWLAIGLAIGGWVVGDFYWYGELVALDAPPYPSWADAAYLTFYPAAYVGIVLLTRSQRASIGASGWLDGLIGTVAVAALLSALVFDPLVAATDGELATVATTLAYPAADVLLLAFLVAGAAAQNWRTGRSFALLGAGLAVCALADTIYLFQAAAGTYAEGGWVDFMWIFVVVMIALAAWQDTTRREAAVADRATPRLMTGVFTSIVCGLMLVDALLVQVNTVARLLLAMAVLLTMLRLWRAGHEARRLAVTQHQAHTDELTSLANRRGFYLLADAALADGRPAAMLLLDLNRFKELNDTLGHQAGDELLRQVADRLRAALSDATVLARLGGDEFVALLAPGSGREHGLAAAAAVRSALEAPFPLEGLLAHTQASVGIAVAPEHGRTRTDLLRYSDIAMYRAKDQGSGVELYAADGNEHSRDRLQLAGELRTAIVERQLVLHFQPKADLATGQVRGVEALVRWEHPRFGLLYPDVFVPIAEHHGLMRDFTRFVIDAALSQQAAWRNEGVHLHVSANLSATNLIDVRFPDDVGRLLDAWEVPPGSLQLELTEDTLMIDPRRALDVLARLSELGVDLSLDDFGTGYSSLAYLKRLPVAELKIDKSFVMDMTADADDAVIVRSTVDLARNLGLHVVAEGVESAEHWELLADMGCHTAQGYYLARPMPAGQVAAWMRGRVAGHANSGHGA